MSNEKTITYWNIVKMIHPDFNPEIQNPSNKMAEATAKKDDEEALYMLAVKWGLIEDDSVEKVDIQYVIDRGKLIRVDQKYEGIVIDLIKKQQFLRVIVYINGSFREFKRNDINDQDENFYVIGYADDEEYNNLDFKYQMIYAERQDG